LWLNFRVRRHPGFLTPRPRRKRRAGRRWLLVLAALAALLGFWWRHEHPSLQKAPASTASVTRKPPPKPFIVAPESPADFPRPVRDVFEAQVALARRAISPGSIDAALGSQTRAAISVFQEFQNLSPTGLLDTNTRARLMLDAPLLTTYTVTTNDLARLQPLGKTWLAKSQQTALEFETELELVAEKSHSHPELVRRLNSGVNWTNLAAGTVLKIPAVEYPAPADKAAFAVIHLSGKYLEAFGAETNLLAHFPCSIAANVEKRPVGELHVIVVIPRPNYTFNPELFPESPEGKTLDHKLILPPGPNNPVGVAWIGLDKTGYGIHGTPNPEQVGRTESHGCFRLANWDAEYVSRLVWVGMPVLVEP
jgi:lipoprotein-anchoring transpeptidase ErfK/SrfK